MEPTRKNKDLVSHAHTPYQDICQPCFMIIGSFWRNKIISSERSNNCLDTSKLQMMYPNVLNIYDAVEKVMQTYH